MTATVILISVVVALFFIVISLFLFIKKIKPGEAGVRTGVGGIKVAKDYMLRVPGFAAVTDHGSLCEKVGGCP